MMKVAITGASGFIGARLAAALTGRGDTVVALVRNPESAKRLAMPLQVVSADLEAGPVPPGAFEGCDALVHLAGETISKRWTRQWKNRIRTSRIRGTRAVVDALRGPGPAPKIFVCASAVGIYGDRGDDRLEESSPPGGGFLADVCREWENEAGQAPSSIRTVFLRSGIVLDTKGGALPKMILPFRAGLGGRLGTGRQWMPWIHIDDETGLILKILDDDSLRGALNAVAPNPVTNAQFTEALGRALHRPAILPAPAFALRALLGEMSALLLEGQRAVPSRAESAGYAFRFSKLDEALSDLLKRRP